MKGRRGYSVTRVHIARLAWLALLLLLVLGGATGAASVHVAATDGQVHLLTIDGVVNPLTAQYLARGVREGADARARAVIVQLDTPGGLESSTREMTQAMLNSSVPVVVYVAPSGARAASAGVFITLARRCG